MSCPLIKRTRNTGDVRDYTDTYLLNGKPYTVVEKSLRVGTFESIEDYVVDWDAVKASDTPPISCSHKKRPLTFNPVTHSRRVYDTNRLEEHVQAWKVANGVLEYTTVSGLVQDALYLNYADVFDLSLKDFSNNQIAEAAVDVMPSFKDASVDGINLYTFLLELADIKTLFKKATWSLKRTFDDLPEKNLLINFALLPLFADIVAIYDIITKLNDYIDKWNDAAVKGLVWDKHETIGIEKGDINANDLSFEYGSSNFVYTANALLEKQNKGIIHLYFKPLFISSQQRRQVFFKALGLGRPLVGAWEAVPFSWAVDYFTNVGDMIASYDDALESMFKYEFVSAGYSVKGNVTGSVVITCLCNLNCARTPGPVYDELDLTTYKRVGLPLSTLFRFSTMPPDAVLGWHKGLRQASYLASVAYLIGMKR